ncbi:general stress protein [Lysinibacillus sphaericus]|uniref:sigma-70 family RNA polymerase sigma factor n=1 Tax=Lysinibacillus sphaericus TaxID=1421 RepID=UPI0018CDEF97|nr:sigma-70 family RNA polymerase sigma factor [Lysinibacillus sphaericus]MBG9456126.1 general stress protein [Lysinibacillus sphaericus]MBG9477497.1 general stress protein [Lysinibacillus sphaericus]MBG9593486.1 general stress protein [Lysinibacillus sphaericus]
MENQKIEEFFYRNNEQVNNPIIKSFLADPHNLYLVQSAILHPTERNKKLVDESFQSHYINVRKIKYVSNLIYFFSLDFDKKRRRLQNRVLLILDKGLSEEGSTTAKELIEDASIEKELDYIVGGGLLDNIEDELLLKSLQKLTVKQLQILEMIYVKELSITEIAHTLQTTPQNISNLHRKALNKLNNTFNKKGE